MAAGGRSFDLLGPCGRTTGCWLHSATRNIKDGAGGESEWGLVPVANCGVTLVEELAGGGDAQGSRDRAIGRPKFAGRRRAGVLEVCMGESGAVGGAGEGGPVGRRE